MKLTAEREKLLGPLQAVIGVVERRQTMPVLANVLLGVRQGQLSITATDLEVELVASTEVTVQEAGDITVPGRKFLDILRALPEKVSVSLTVEGEKVIIKAGRSRFSLSNSSGIGAMSVLKRSEEPSTPSWPLDVTYTALPVRGVP